ncbi:MAG TPA: hypothetical protein VFR13_02105 [Jiangellaceae bacterium]|nr:hypothetical protein [Jiangellaceae bacterium]
MPNPNLDPDRRNAGRGAERNRDPGADPEREGLPEVADDETPGAGTVPEPQQVTVPTEEPVAATSYGTTMREQVEGEPLELRLAHEEPERPETEDPDDRLAAEEAAMRVEEGPPS